VAARYQYDEFGVPQAAEKFDPNWSGPDNLYGYTGLGYDYSSGLTYARARYYQPELGRFISEDTYEGDLTNPLSLNLYRYVENNPLRYVDPTGNQIMDAGGSADEVYYYYDSDNVRKLSETGEIDYSYYLWWRSYNQEAFDALANSGEGISLNQLFAMRYTIMGKAMLDGQANVSDAGAGITLSGIVGGVKV
ncbi:MAG: hypothetical protein K0R57_6086, partial [Paenibacillaceae bacterium]|nr:hypothetical protein [Paenibacillaceae bacterium]